ncbi:hypothetical protein TL16_g11835 [Triparma laevis f. inornata]|uniref:Asparagine synthetase domain-containing protein n=1 Tax=Triparma laevis f. inornata TaxID=1714386 RepID=A0A9W7BNW8_9STRA|nr:hypothetical protein TL16_g11835 [Triparma laevis f. inornata]
MDFNLGTCFYILANYKGYRMSVEECEIELRDYDGEFLRRDVKTEGSIQPEHEVRENCKGCKRKIKLMDEGCVFGCCRVCCSGITKKISSFIGGKVRCCDVHNDRIIKKSTKSVKKPIKKEYVKRICIYKSLSQIIYTGHGADELLAGYGRHRTAYLKGGYKEVTKVLKNEVGRLWERNLGRDDRCISSGGKEARFIFLEDGFVEFIQSLDVTFIADFELGQGVGDKRILRRYAEELGLKECGNLVKRAMQFGSRIGKVVGGEKGDEEFEKSEKFKPPTTDPTKYDKDYRFDITLPDWLPYLQTHGYCVISSAVSSQNTNLALKSLITSLKLLHGNDVDTWDIPEHGLISETLGQSSGAWLIRGSSIVKSAFERIWEEKDLIVSMDCVIIWLSWLNNSNFKPRSEGLHLDQNPFNKLDMISVQGMIPLIDVTEEIGGLQIIPGSHVGVLKEEFKDMHGDMRGKGDWCQAKEEYVEGRGGRRGWWSVRQGI